MSAVLECAAPEHGGAPAVGLPCSCPKGSTNEKYRVPPYLRHAHGVLRRAHRGRLRFERRRRGQRKDPHHGQLRAAEERQGRPLVLRRRHQEVREGQPGHRRRHARRVPVSGPQDLRRQAHAAARWRTCSTRTSPTPSTSSTSTRPPTSRVTSRTSRATAPSSSNCATSTPWTARSTASRAPATRWASSTTRSSSSRPAWTPTSPGHLGGAARGRQEDRRARQGHGRIRRLQRPEPGRLALHRRGLLAGRERRLRGRQEGDRRHPRGQGGPAEPQGHALGRQLHGQQATAGHQRRPADDGLRQARHVPLRARQHPDPRQGEGRQLQRPRPRAHARRQGHAHRRRRLHVQQEGHPGADQGQASSGSTTCS